MCCREKRRGSRIDMEDGRRWHRTPGGWGFLGNQKRSKICGAKTCSMTDLGTVRYEE